MNNSPNVWDIIPLTDCPSAIKFDCPFCGAEPDQLCMEFAHDQTIELGFTIHFGRLIVAEKT